MAAKGKTNWWKPIRGGFIVNTLVYRCHPKSANDKLYHCFQGEGGGHLGHQKVTVDFNYIRFDSCKEIADCQRKRLDHLEEFFSLVLENVYQLVPIDEHLQNEKRICNLLKGLMKRNPVLEEAASIFKSLGEKGVKYNKAEKIMDLLEDPRDVDNLTIRIQELKKTKVEVTNAEPIFVRPERETRWKELPENSINKIHQMMVRALSTDKVNDIEEFFDILVNVNTPDGTVLFNVNKRPEVIEELSKYTSSQRRTMISTFLKELQRENITVGRLTEAFVTFKEEHWVHETYATILTALIDGMETIMEETKYFSEEEAREQLTNDRSLKTFLKFLIDHQPNGMKKYAKAKGYKKEQFLMLAKDKQILPGDMIGFYRKQFSIDYVHAGIYAPYNNQMYVIHVQGQRGLLKSMKKCAEVKCDKLEEVVAKNDIVFFIRDVKTQRAQADILSKVEACLFEEAIQFRYNGYYCSSQTFCSKILGSKLYSELNPEAAHEDANRRKAIAGWYLSSEDDSDLLIRIMTERFKDRRPFDLQQEDDEDLLTTCPDRLGLGLEALSRSAWSRSLDESLDVLSLSRSLDESRLPFNERQEGWQDERRDRPADQQQTYHTIDVPYRPHNHMTPDPHSTPTAPPLDTGEKTEILLSEEPKLFSEKEDETLLGKERTVEDYLFTKVDDLSQGKDLKHPLGEMEKMPKEEKGDHLLSKEQKLSSVDKEDNLLGMERTMSSPMEDYLAKRATSESKPDNFSLGRDWEHLLCIFPNSENIAFGLDGLMEAASISAEDLNFKDESLGTSQTRNAASNWEMILQKMLPDADEAGEAIYSLHEVFEINENSFKAFNAFRLLQSLWQDERRQDIREKRTDLINVLKVAVETNNRGCILDTIIDEGIPDTFFSDAQVNVLRENSLSILERLLPFRAVELKAAIETLFKEDKNCKMAAVYHVLQRYSDYGFTSMKALLKLLMDETLINSSKEIIGGSDMFEFVRPAVSFELKLNMEWNKTEEEIKRSLQDILNNFLTDENAILWMNQEYERSRKAYNWEPLTVTLGDSEKVKIVVEKAWFGDELHQKITIEFSYEEYNNNSEIRAEEQKRMNQLAKFFQLVLENVHQLIPLNIQEVEVGENMFEIRQTPTRNEKNSEAYMYDISRTYKLLRCTRNAREQMASLFRSLKDIGAEYQQAQKIYDLLSSDRDVDNLKVEVQTAKKLNQTSLIGCSPIFVHTEKKTRLKELPEEFLSKVRNVMMTNLTVMFNNHYYKFFDIFINLEDPALFISDVRERLSGQVVKNEKMPLTMVTVVFNKLKELNRSLQDLVNAFVVMKEDPNIRDYAEAMTNLISGIEELMTNAKEMSEKEANKQFANDRRLETFVKFLKDHCPCDGDGVKKYAAEKGFEHQQFLELVRKQEVIPGDIIGFYRKKKWAGGLSYAHAAIYAPFPPPFRKCVVHIQPTSGKSAEVKIGDLEKVVLKGDRIFYIRECQDSRDQSVVLSKLEVCISPVLQYTYDANFGSCQTFCSKIFGSNLLVDLNPEAFLTQSKRKTFAKWLLSSKNWKSLTKEMEKRFEDISMADLPPEGSPLIKTYMGSTMLQYPR